MSSERMTEKTPFKFTFCMTYLSHHSQMYCIQKLLFLAFIEPYTSRRSSSLNIISPQDTYVAIYLNNSVLYNPWSSIENSPLTLIYLIIFWLQGNIDVLVRLTLLDKKMKLKMQVLHRQSIFDGTEKKRKQSVLFIDDAVLVSILSWLY